MKLIIWWLSLMVILPLIYLLIWKKSWRLPLGIIVLIIAGISFFLPDEIVRSLVNRKIKKEQKNLVQQSERIQGRLNALRNKDFSQPSNSESTEKIALEKEIAELDKEIKPAFDLWLEWLKKREGPEPDNPIKNPEIQKKDRLKKEKGQEWTKKWSGEKSIPLLFFQGKEQAKGLEKLNETGGGNYGELSISTIDFKDHKQIEPVQKEIIKLVDKERKKMREYEKITGGETYTPVFWFKNVNQIKKDSELENFLLDLLNKREKFDSWEYQEWKVDFSKFIIVVNVVDSPNLPSALRVKLNHYKPVLDRYQPTILVVTGVGEIILFLVLIKISWKRKSIVK